MNFFLKVNQNKNKNIIIIANEFMKQIINHLYSQENIKVFNSNIKIVDYKENVLFEISEIQ
jgi:hypothetical protein